MKLKYKILNLVDSFFYQSNSRSKTILANTINFLMLIILILTFCFYDVYPFNLINKILYSLISLGMVIYVLMYGNVKIGIFSFLIISFFSFLILSFLLNKSSSFQTTLITLLLTSFCFYQYYSTDKKMLKIAISLLLLAGLIFTVYFAAIYYRELLSLDLSTRLGKKISNENDVAMLLLITGSLFFYCIMKKKFFLIPFALLNAFEMLSTGSRSGLIFLIFMMLVIVYMTIGYRKKILFFILLLAIIVVAVSILQFPFVAPLKIRFEDMLLQLLNVSNSNITDTSTNSRITAALEGIEMMLYNPFFGVGNETAMQFTNWAMVIHNAYLEIGLAYGVIALLIYISFSLFPIYHFFKKRKSVNDVQILLAILLIAVCVFLITLSAYRFKPHFFVIALAFAAIDERCLELKPIKYVQNLFLKIKKTSH